jgi:hypothetical protein
VKNLVAGTKTALAVCTEVTMLEKEERKTTTAAAPLQNSSREWACHHR